MADEARMVFEFVDRGGSRPGGGSTTAPMSGSTPGADLAEETGKAITAAGGAARLADPNNPADDGERPRWRGTPRHGRNVPPVDASDVPPGGGVSIATRPRSAGDAADDIINATLVETAEQRTQRNFDTGASGVETILNALGMGRAAAVGRAGLAAAQAGGLNVAGMLGAGGAASFAAAVPPVAAAVVAGAAVAAIPVAAATAVNRIADTAARQIGGLSPDVAQADAEARVREIMANLRTAERVGPQLAANTASQSRLRTELQGIQDEFLRGVTPYVTEATDAAVLIAKVTKGAAQFAADAASNKIVQAIPFGGLMTGLAEISRKLDKFGDASNPLFYWGQQEHLPLPHPFTETSERPLNVELTPVPGLGF